MKRIMLLSEDESNVYILKHLQDEGCDVMLMTPRGEGAVGSVPRAENGAAALAWEPEYVICDSPGFGPYLKRFREAGAQILGGGNITDMLSTSPAYALNFLDASGVPTCEHQVFKDVGSAITYVEDSTKSWRLHLDDSDSRGYETGLALSLELEALSQSGELPNKFVLTRDYPGIIDGRICMWSNFHLVGFVTPKGLMNPCFAMRVAQGLGEGGIPTLEGVSLTPVQTDNPIIQLTLDRLSNSLSKIDYTGPITLGCIVEGCEDSSLDVWYDRICVHSIASTPPPGFWAAMLSGLELPLHLFLDRLLNPARPNNPFPFWGGWVSSRRLTIPPYPLTEAPWLTPEQKSELITLAPPIKIPYKPAVFWNGVSYSEDEADTLLIKSATLGYVVGKGRGLHESTQQITTEYCYLDIPYSQISNTGDSTLEIDILPLGIAERQLEWEEEEDHPRPPALSGSREVPLAIKHEAARRELENVS